MTINKGSPLGRTQSPWKVGRVLARANASRGRRPEYTVARTQCFGVSLPRERFWDIPVPKIDSPTRQPLCPGRPAVGAGLDQHTPSPTPPTNGLTACRMSLQIFSAATGNTPLRHCENPPGPTPTGDYQPSLRSPWLAASAGTAKKNFTTEDTENTETSTYCNPVVFSPCLPCFQW